VLTYATPDTAAMAAASTLPPLPPGFEYAPAPAAPPYTEPVVEQPAPPRRPAGPPMSGHITTVTSHSDTTITIHRADYTATDHLGEYTVHGYAWRCTGCRTLTSGYEPREFAECLGDGRNHHCGARHG
jgi:hypothetical protein